MLIDPESVLEKQYSGRLSELPLEQRSMIRKSLVRTIADDLRLTDPRVSYYGAQQKASMMVSEAERRGAVGELAHKFHPIQRYSASIGLSAASQAGALGAVLAGALDAAFQLSATGDIDALELGSLVGLGATSGFVGTWSGAQTQYALNSQPAQRLASQLGRSILQSMRERLFLERLKHYPGGRKPHFLRVSVNVLVTTAPMAML